MKPELRDALRARLGDRVRFEAPMSRQTSLRVGGPVDALTSPADRDEVAEVLSLCARFDAPVMAVGGGFNLLVRDGGLRGVVIQSGKLRSLRVEASTLEAAAGVSHSQVIRCCTEAALSGLEFAAGIPGSVGGWIAMNAGIPGREMSDVVSAVVLATAEGVETRPASALGFRYRAADGLGDAAVVVGARFELEPGDADALRESVSAHLEKRRLTQPVDQPSCGSVFKNPPGDHAGRLIEAAGLKGYRRGGASISSVHANFIVTTREARASDVLAVIEHAQDQVLQASGILLEPEVRIVGEAG